MNFSDLDETPTPRRHADHERKRNRDTMRGVIGSSGQTTIKLTVPLHLGPITPSTLGLKGGISCDGRGHSRPFRLSMTATSSEAD